MSESKTILVPIDFSDCAMDVVRKASEEAERSGARLVLMHALQLPEGISPSAPVRPAGSTAPSSALDHLRAEAEQRMPAYVEKAREKALQVEVRIEVGESSELIVAAAKELGADRIVMGTHGRKGLSKIMLGSVADKVRKNAPCPVDAVPTVYKSHCKAGSCAWCATHTSSALIDLRTEQAG